MQTTAGVVAASTCLWAAALFAGSPHAGGEGVGAQPVYHWQRTSTSLALLNRERIVWQFNYGPDISKPYFHPIALTDGTVLTCLSPKDHPWHHALWFSWEMLNGVNYWEEDRKTGLAEGRTEVLQAKVALITTTPPPCC